MHLSFAFFNAFILILLFIHSSRALPVAPEIANTDIDAPRPDPIVSQSAHSKKSSLKKRWYGGLGVSMYGGWGHGGFGMGFGGYGFGGYGYGGYGYGYPYYGYGYPYYGYGYGYPYHDFW